MFHFYASQYYIIKLSQGIYEVVDHSKTVRNIDKEDEVITEDGCSDLIIMPRNRESSDRKFPEKEKQN